MSGRNPHARIGVAGGQVGAVGALCAQGVMSGSFHPQQSPLVLQDLPHVCSLAREAKIDSWHQVLDLCSSLLNRLLCLPREILLQLQATEAFWLRSSWFKGENTG